MKWEEVIEAHRQKTLAYVARHYNVSVERVRYIGELPDPFGYRTICDHAKQAVFEVHDGPEVWVTRPPTIELSRQFEHVDNVLNRKTELFVGQCPDCGQVFVAEFEPNLRYRQK